MLHLFLLYTLFSLPPAPLPACLPPLLVLPFHIFIYFFPDFFLLIFHVCINHLIKCLLWQSSAHWTAQETPKESGGSKRGGGAEVQAAADGLTDALAEMKTIIKIQASVKNVFSKHKKNLKCKKNYNFILEMDWEEISINRNNKYMYYK